MLISYILYTIKVSSTREKNNSLKKITTVDKTWKTHSGLQVFEGYIQIFLRKCFKIKSLIKSVYTEQIFFYFFYKPCPSNLR